MSLTATELALRDLNLSEPMKAALRGSADGVLLTGVRAGTVCALIKRGLVTAGYTHYLTSRGTEVLELLERAETAGTDTVRTESLVYQVTVASVYVAGEVQLKYTVWGGEAHGTDTWTVPTGTPAAQALEPRGWKLAGRLRFDAAAGTYGGYVVRAEQPAQVELAPVPPVTEFPASEPVTPKPHLERVSHQVEQSEDGGLTWRNLMIPAFGSVDAARNVAAQYGARFPGTQFRVVEIRQIHTVV